MSRPCIRVQRDDPDVRRLRVHFQIHVDYAEDDPPAVGRDLRIADALQLHHVFKCEGMLGLGESGKSEGENEKREKKPAHKRPPTKSSDNEIMARNLRHEIIVPKSWHEIKVTKSWSEIIRRDVAGYVSGSGTGAEPQHERRRQDVASNVSTANG
jgi:hypothetical protein